MSSQTPETSGGLQVKSPVKKEKIVYRRIRKDETQTTSFMIGMIYHWFNEVRKPAGNLELTRISVRLDGRKRTVVIRAKAIDFSTGQKYTLVYRW